MVYVCADDYGMTTETCRRIEECVKYGALNRISIFPNTEIENITDRIPKNISLGVHINLVEGKPLTNPQDVNLLVNDSGYFKYSFTDLFLLSVSPKRKEFERQIYSEIKNQIERWRNNIATGAAVEIDSHQHTHMIPLIFKVLMRVIKDEKINVDYIRIPSEPILPYLFTPSLYFTYKPVNLIKQWLLKFFALINRRELKKSKISTSYFMGILFSGKMDKKRVNKVLPYYYKLAEKNNEDIEILFHPGYLKDGESIFDENKKGFKKFYFSKDRKMEFDTLKKLKIK